jgi:hypothetical protein
LNVKVWNAFKRAKLDVGLDIKEIKTDPSAIFVKWVAYPPNNPTCVRQNFVDRYGTINGYLLLIDLLKKCLTFEYYENN